jgi:hypothetical protein
MSFNLKVTCFGLGPDHHQAKYIQSLKGKLRMQLTEHHILHGIPVLQWCCFTIKQ